MRFNKVIQKSLFPDIVPDEQHGDSKVFYTNIDGNKYHFNKSVLNMIRHECSNIISLYKKTNKFFFRGIGGDSGRDIDYKIKKYIPRTDRYPKDTPSSYHFIADNIFYDKFGWKARSEGVFVISDYGIAKSYNRPHIFLPVNGYKYLWSNKYKDLYSDFFEDLENDVFEKYQATMESTFEDEKGNTYDTIGDAISSINGLGIIDVEEVSDDMVFHYIETRDSDDWIKITEYRKSNDSEDDIRENLIIDAIGTYQSTHLEEAIKSMSEVMFKCKYYYAIDISDISKNYVLNELNIEDFGV